MSVTETTYYGLTRVREQSPEAKDWATVDRNPEVFSLVLKAFEQHAHTGALGVKYPGYSATVPILPTLAEVNTGGVLTPGTTVGVRLSYVNAAGLETNGSPEIVLTLSPATGRPLTPTLVSTAISPGALNGGTYIYAITKRKGSGETQISDVLPVTIPYDNTYSVTVGFTKISDYPAGEGITGLNIYRSAGLSSGFQLVTTITDTAAATFTDTNTIPPENLNIAPPINNTFDASRKLSIDWSTITHPVGAQKLRVYITQQAGLWSTDHLHSEIDLTTSPPPGVDYLGSETLGPGWPSNSSQIPNAPPKIDLGTETIGAPSLTADMDFNGFKAAEMVLGNTSQNIEGALWYDTGTKKYRGYANGSQVDLSPPKILKNWIWNPSAEIDASKWSRAGTGTAPTFSKVGLSPGSPEGVSVFQIVYPTAITSSGFFSIWPRSAADGTSTVTEMVPVKSTTERFFGRAQLRVTANNLTAGGWIRLQVSYYNSANTVVATRSLSTQPVGVYSISDPVLNTWYQLQGFDGTAPPATAVYAVLLITIENGTTAQGAGNFTMQYDQVLAAMTPGATSSDIISYFDGDRPGSQWQGTPHGSTSISGAFQHGVEEAGGHKAQDITFPGGTNVGTLLSRLFDPTTGARTQVQTVVQSKGVASSPSITDTSNHLLDDMSVTITPQFTGQWIRIDFTAKVQLSVPTGATFSTFTISLGVNSTTVGQTSTEIAQEAVRDGQNLGFSAYYYYQSISTAPITFSILGRVGGNGTGMTATLLQTNRIVTANLVF